MKTLVSVVLIVMAGYLASCFDDADAQSASLAALEARIAALEANRPGDRAFAAPENSGPAKAASDGKLLGTTLGFSAAPYLSDEITIKSAAGYLFVANSVGQSGVTGPNNHALFYESNDCTGQAYMSGISSYAAQQGYVFTILANAGTTWDNPAQFFYVPAGSVDAGPLAFGSRLAAVDQPCSVQSGNEVNAFPAIANDSNVTGVDGGPIKLPVTIG